jgi:hypothetical protein
MDIVIIGIDLGKNSCSLAGMDAYGRTASWVLSRMWRVLSQILCVDDAALEQRH